ncbi:hypothetical protein ETB97_002790 [Aspergillus alliaceus]|uniref:Uncharacterized protein n=1 Tax=Petromyces alliaceus TaxID=209559 RepID=A0A8H6A3K4_PETAA|nr:hypothetical protein ETB97_002790 [Aspergillus burnettii]
MAESKSGFQGSSTDLRTTTDSRQLRMESCNIRNYIPINQSNIAMIQRHLRIIRIVDKA